MTPKLLNAITRRVGGRETLLDVARHGADAGWPGFTYYTDTAAFFRAHRADIVAAIEDMAEDLGEDPVSMIRGFRCLHGDYTSAEVGRALYGHPSKADPSIVNALAWFALEEAAHSIEQ